MRSTLKALAVSSVLALGASANAAILDAPVPADATVIIGGLQWAWALPVAGDGSFGAGTGLDLSFQGPLGWRAPTPADMLSAPVATDFVFAGANVPLGGVDPVSGASFSFGPVPGAAACAAPYFSAAHSHCDWGNAPGSAGGLIVPWWPDAGFVSFSESLAVRDVDRVPEPASLALLGLGIAGLGLARRRRS